MSSQMYYIFSAKWTNDTIGVATWWRPDNNGYCYRLDWAGKYTQEQIDEHPEYYNNGHSTVAVPCEVVDERTIRVVEVGGFLNEYADKARDGEAAREKQAKSGADPSQHGVPVS